MAESHPHGPIVQTAAGAVRGRTWAGGYAFLAVPYAYVGPWAPREGEFWNQPFGAAKSLTELPDAEAVAAWFAVGLESAARDPLV